MGRPGWIPILFRTGLVVAALAAVVALSAWLRTQRALGPMPEAQGIERQSSEDWGRIVMGAAPCVLVNNVWNKQAARGRLQQQVFVGGHDGHETVGWAWRSPWQLVPRVVSYPEVVCGDKPWDQPLRLSSAFPFAVGSRRLIVDYDVRVRATGTHNLAFTLWVVSALPAARNLITHEIMVWIANEGQRPAGKRTATLRLGAADLDAFIEVHQGDASGSSANQWAYVAFVARRPILHGPLDVGPLLDYLLARGLLSPRHLVTSLELGSEVSEGTGLVEIADFCVTVR
jgi:hypothetical protein